MQPNWDDLKTVLELVRRGNLAGAAAELGVSYTTVARRVSRLEACLDSKLFDRMADGYEPTDTALLLAEHAARMRDEEHSLLRKLMGRDPRLSGPLTITAPQLLIAHVLSPTLARFSQQHPDVELNIKASNELLDLSRREADLAIRISRSPGDTLKGLRLTEQHSASFATPEWAERIAHDPKGTIDWIVYTTFEGLPETVMQNYPGSQVRYRFDDMVAMEGAAQAGLGVVRMPMFLGRALPGLVQVPVLTPQPYMEIWVVGHPDVWASAKVTAFRQAVQTDLRDMRSRFLA